MTRTGNDLPSPEILRPATSPPRTSGMRTLVGCALGCLGVTVLAGIAIAGLIWYGLNLWQSAPPQWDAEHARRASLPDDQQAERAAALEQRIARAISFTDASVTAVERGEPLPGAVEADPAVAAEETVTVGVDELNDWLDTRLEEWLANQGQAMPSDWSTPTVWVEDGMPVVAASMSGQVFSARLDLQMQPDGKAVFRIDSIQGGQIPLPVTELIKENAKELRARGATEAAAADVLAGMPFDPAVQIDEARRARLVGFETRANELVARIRAEPQP